MKWKMSWCNIIIFIFALFPFPLVSSVHSYELFLPGIYNTSDSQINPIDSLNQWYYRAADVTNIFYGGNLFVAGYANGSFAPGDEAGILTSSDGINYIWRETISGTAYGITGTTYGNNIFVSVGGGDIYNSSDGKKWSKVFETTYNIRGIVFGKDKFYVFGDFNGLLVSQDGMFWSLQFSDTLGYVASLKLLNNILLGNCTSGGLNGNLTLSYDGNNWENIKFTNKYVTAIGYGNGKYFVSLREFQKPASLKFSTDLINWSDLPSNVLTLSEGHTITYCNSTFLLGGGENYYTNNKFYYSTNEGNNWTEISPSPDLGGSIICAKGKFYSNSNQGIESSLNGITWKKETNKAFDDSLTNVIYADSQFIAIDNRGGIFKSFDGRIWNLAKKYERFPDGSYYSLYGIVFGNDTYVIVGYHYTYYDVPIYDGFIVTSTDGISWKSQIMPNKQLKSVTFGSSKFIAVAENAILQSPDGIYWAEMNLPSDFNKNKDIIKSVTWGNNVFVAVGYTILKDNSTQSLVLTSTDGSNWKRIVLPEPNPNATTIHGELWDVYFALNSFTALGSQVYTSGDGLNWKVNSKASNLGLNAISTNNKFLVAVNGGCHIFVSTDNIDWQDIGQRCDLGLGGITFGGNTFVAVGGGGIIQSGLLQ